MMVHTIKPKTITTDQNNLNDQFITK